MSGLEITFLAALLTVLYAYVGFPLLTLIRGCVWRKPYRREPVTPSVSLVVCCFNEEEGIAAKLHNLLAMDYPKDKLQILVASDGSTDRTEEIVAGFQDQGIRLLRLPRQGKAAALNASVAMATGEVLVFSDANSMYAPDALRELVQPFADEIVGGVAGNQVYRKSYEQGLAASGELSYWDFDRWMKILQTRSGNTISATGAIYAIRKKLFQAVPEGVTDDFVTSTRVIEQGYRLVFEPKAVCFEPVAGGTKAEFGRKARVITRGLRGVIKMRSLLNPLRFGFYSVQMFSHKVLRRLVVFALILMAVTAPLLWQERVIYQVITVAQTALYLAALAGMLCSRMGRRPPKVLSIPVYFCMINAAVLSAVWTILKGDQITVWNPHRGNLSTATK